MLNLEKGVFCLVLSVGQKKFWSLSEESNLRPSDYALQCSTNEPQRLYSELGHHEVHILTLGGNLIAILFVK